MYKFSWNPIETYCNQLLPQEIIDKILKHESYYYTRWDDRTKRKTAYPIKKTVHWDFYDYANNSFPSGFLSQIVNSIGTAECSIDCIFEKPQNSIPYLKKRFAEFLEKRGIQERYFQSEAAQIIEEYGNGVIEIGTAGGKTILYGGITARLGVKTLVVTIDLISRDSTYKEFVEFFGKDSVSTIDEEKYFTPIVVANIQNLWAKLKANNQEFLTFLNSINLLIVNECHHINENKLIKKTDLGNTWYALCQKIPAYYRVGGTGTVGKEGTLGRALLTATIGDVVYTKGTRELIDEGFATNIEVHVYQMDIPNDEHVSYTKAYQNMIEYEPFNKMIANIAIHYAKDKKVIVFCDWVAKQAIKLQELIGEENCFLIHGGTKKDQRDSILYEFKKLKFGILIGTVFSEDFNLPALDVGIIIGKKKNERAVKQRTGRLTRLFVGKDTGILVVPFVQDWKTIRGADGDTIEVPGMLAKHSAEALKILTSEGYEIKMCDPTTIESDCLHLNKKLSILIKR